MNAAEMEVPFPGLRSFRTSESHLFFGRDEQVESLLARLAKRRLLAVVGTSGSGKSSLVHAGLIPALERGFLGAPGSRWIIAVLWRPGSGPLEGLARALAEAFQFDTSEAPGVLAMLKDSSSGLRDFAQRRLRPGEQLMVVVDQFEELFRYRRQTGDRGRVESTAFVKLLLGAIGNYGRAPSSADPPVYVVLTMRSDYLGRCAQFRGLPEALNDAQYLVPCITRDQQREAIEGPLAFAGVQITGRLVERILNDAGDDPDQLPVLQHALLRVWEQSADSRARNRALDLPHYEDPSVGGIAGALNQDAENAFRRLRSVAQTAIARRMFQRLIEPGTEDEETRRPTPLSEIALICRAPENAVLAVIEVFRERGFLTLSSDLPGEKDPLVDISHESLIRQWKRLKEWVQEEARSAAIYSRLAESALNRRALYRGPDLAQALRWEREEAPNRDWASRYNQNPEAWESTVKFLRTSQNRQTLVRIGYLLPVAAAVASAAKFSGLFGKAERGTAPGTLVLCVLVSVLLAVPVSLLLIWLYRNAVARAVRTDSGARESAVPFDLTSHAREPRNPSELRNRERRQRLRLALVYAVAGAWAAAVWGYFYCQASGIELTAIRGFAVWYVSCWPVPFTLITLLAIPWRRSLWFVTAYLVAGMLIIVVWSTVTRIASGHLDFRVMANLQSFLQLLAIQACLPALIILIASSRRIRGVSPLALAGLLVFTVGSAAATDISVVLLDVGGLRNLLLTIGPKWWSIFATVSVGYVCWRLLTLLNAGYRRKAFSDVQLVVDSLWVIITFVFSAQSATDVGWNGVAAGLAGFVAYRVVAQLGLAIWRPPNEPGVRLLILRVGGFGVRTAKLFDSVVQRWRFRGGVAMIADTDLATRNIDLDKTLAFLAGRLRSRFIQGPYDLEKHLNLMDESCDPDSRFRITEFFCYANTWSDTVAALVGRSDTILMDLRGFSNRNTGAIFELHQIMAQKRLFDTMFVVDASTDVEFLESVVSIGEPETTGNAVLRLEYVQSDAAAERERVYRSLCLLSGSRDTCR